VDAERDDVVGDAANKKAHNRIEFGGTGGVPVGLSGASNKEKSQIQRSRSRGHGTKTTKLASTPPSPTKSFDGTNESIEEDRESVVDSMSTSLCEETVPQWQNEMMIQALDTHLEIKDSCKVYPEVACMVDEAFAGLNDVFFGKDGYLISEQEATKIIESGGGVTYGEVLPTGCDQILHFFGMDENAVFADLGAGTGRMCLHISAARRLKKVRQPLNDCPSHPHCAPGPVQFTFELLAHVIIRFAVTRHSPSRPCAICHCRRRRHSRLCAILTNLRHSHQFAPFSPMRHSRLCAILTNLPFALGRLLGSSSPTVASTTEGRRSSGCRRRWALT